MFFFRKTRRELERQRWELAEKESDLAKERADIDERLANLELLVSDRVAGYEHIAQAWADWEFAQSERDANNLRHKKHPARTAAEVVREKGREMAELRRRMKLAETHAVLHRRQRPW